MFKFTQPFYIIKVVYMEIYIKLLKNDFLKKKKLINQKLTGYNKNTLKKDFKKLHY